MRAESLHLVSRRWSDSCAENLYDLLMSASLVFSHWRANRLIPGFRTLGKGIPTTFFVPFHWISVAVLIPFVILRLFGTDKSA